MFFLTNLNFDQLSYILVSLLSAFFVYSQSLFKYLKILNYFHHQQNIHYYYYFQTSFQVLQNFFHQSLILYECKIIQCVYQSQFYY